ncbi:MAG: hypothetical protein LUC96_09835 [Alistipes sp.]|uniref:hypothetical protein n=1 Tax=Alistipes sp. TaxID=1872444 RepID=UPI0025BE099E|nr:hypothetical protein [Alistipes sp.]MCD8275270.1 hypothetical protein [Alistipes sp.]
MGIKQAIPNKIINQTIGVRNRSLPFLFDTDDKQVTTKSPINKEYDMAFVACADTKSNG